MAARRRHVLLGVALAWGGAAGWAFAHTVPPGTPRSITAMLGVVFSALFAWVAWNAATAVVGGMLLLFRPRPQSRRRGAMATPAARVERRDAAATDGQIIDVPGGHVPGRTAIVFPICDEDTQRAFAGLEATYRSLAGTGRLSTFDVYVLSDSRDLETRMREEAAWFELCKTVNGLGRIFYRRRDTPSGGKSGNIADFCRRWGQLYRYMVVLDADSIMAGATITRLVDLMEANPGVGIIQTVPVPANRSSLFARIRQFASRLYGPLSTAGLAFWQMGDGVFWGHNAIIRVEPFMASCGLPRLPGSPPLGGQIMSHDVVEAAFLGRAGWTVWLAQDLDGSYEEIPPTLPDYLTRDRRWCRGNLQHGRVLWQPGLSFGHRLHLALGICSYAAALLWLLFLVAEMIVAAGVRPAPDIMAMAAQFRTERVFFVAAEAERARGLAVLAGWVRSEWAFPLLGATGALLLIPKVLGLALVLRHADEARRFGGRLRCTVSAALELVFSALMAPIIMVSHAWFVISILTGARVRWTSPPRNDYALRWRDAFAHHTGATAVGTAWVAAAAQIHHSAVVEWLAPILVGLLLSIPISVFSSSTRLGNLARRWGLFVTPEEAGPPPVLRELELALTRRRARDQQGPRPSDAFVQAVVDPIANAQHVWQARFRACAGSSSAAHLVEKALHGGPASLSVSERAAILDDAEALAGLHVAVWSAPRPQARGWRPTR